MPPGQRRSPLVTRRARAASYEDYLSGQYRWVSVGPDDLATVLDPGGDKLFVTGTSEDGSARVTFADDRGRVTEVLSQVRQTGKPALIPILSAQSWSVARISAATDGAQPSRRWPTRSPRSRRAATASRRQGTERGRGD